MYTTKNHKSRNQMVSTDEVMHLFSQHLVVSFFHNAEAPGHSMMNSAKERHTPCLEKASSLLTRVPSLLVTKPIIGFPRSMTEKAFAAKPRMRFKVFTFPCAFNDLVLVSKRRTTKKALLSNV